MRTRSQVVLASALCLVLVPATLLAQPTRSAHQTQQQLVDWLDDYRAWHEWMSRWGNRIAYNAAGGIQKKRPVRPDPPGWLWAECGALIWADGPLGEACEILSTWNEHPLLAAARRSSSSSRGLETAPKSTFLQRLHVSGGWVPAQLPAPNVYLVAGMSVGVVEVGRLTLPAVGVGLIAMSDGAGGYEWKPATVIGLGYRVGSFPFPGAKREAHLHLNIARATIHGTSGVTFGLDPTQNLIGFSLTFGRQRP